MAGTRQRLHDEHVRLNRLFDELVDTVETADEPTIVRMWTEFERGLLTHFDAEERDILPGLEARHGEEVRAIRSEHDRIREMVAELGVRADLHTLRKGRVDELVAALHDHAHREDDKLYQWAEQELDESVLSRLGGRVI